VKKIILCLLLFAIFCLFHVDIYSKRGCGAGCSCSGCRPSSVSSYRGSSSHCCYSYADSKGSFSKYCQCCNPSCCASCDYGVCAVKKDNKRTKKSNSKSVKQSIKDAYSKVAKENSGCCGGCCGGGADLSQYLGYSAEELKNVPEANLGLGCGNPASLGDFKKGDVVLDLGSGAGMDCFLAAKMVGDKGKVIGVDMTKAMIKKARKNAKKHGFKNVEFRLGDIEKLPVKDNSVDIVISNCVINLATDKQKVFDEAYRVLKSGGKMYISDVVLLKELSEEQRNDTSLICACVGGALLKDDYIERLKKAGFTVEIVDEDTQIGKKWFKNDDLPIESMKYIASKR